MSQRVVEEGGAHGSKEKKGTKKKKHVLLSIQEKREPEVNTFTLEEKNGALQTEGRLRRGDSLSSGNR